MRRLDLAALPRTLPFPPWIDGEGRPGPSLTPHTFDHQVREGLPSEGF